ncbi:hypothetical protein [Engelhardtia mirabilis]|uniref:Uncharacterized protein n=1 Tax=Engelhardtia mirabilis TaxID=2528011 RepID=A0A518BSL9_9BACT|nr:hypothetical protein Pla133_50940 [Planctomycetes bacterium Pla133]QDV04296.1 hypothetical protein Pla86_50910 [Planctomycetes bacterium Pla86]
MLRHSTALVIAAFVAAPTASAQIVEPLVNATLLHNDADFHDLAVTPDGRWGVARSSSSVALIEMKTGTVSSSITYFPTESTFIPNPTSTPPLRAMNRSIQATNTRVLTASVNGKVRIYGINESTTPASLDLLAPASTGTGNAFDCILTPDGSKGLVVHDAGPTEVFDMSTGALLGTLTGSGKYFGPSSVLNPLDVIDVTDDYAVTIAPASTGGTAGAGSILVHDLNTLSTVTLSPAPPTGAYHDLDISPNGLEVLVAANSGPMQHLRLTSGAPVYLGSPGSSGSAFNLAQSIWVQEMVQATDSVGMVIDARFGFSGPNVQFVQLNGGTVSAAQSHHVASAEMHDCAFNTDGTRAIVHGSSLTPSGYGPAVQIFDTSAPAAVLALGSPLASPGHGYMATFDTSSPILMPNSLEATFDRAIAAGNTDPSPNGSGRVIVYDLGIASGTPGILNAFIDSTNFLRYYEVAVTPGGNMGVARIAMGATPSKSPHFDMVSGSFVGAAESSAPGSSFESRNTVALTDARALFGGGDDLPAAPFTQYAVNKVFELPYSFGTANANSSGLPATLSYTGTPDISTNNFDFVISDLPPIPFGGSVPVTLFYSLNRFETPYLVADGNMYLAPTVVRLATVNATSDPFTISFDLSAPLQQANIAADDVVHFQVFYRDNPVTTGGTNITQGITAHFHQ